MSPISFGIDLIALVCLYALLPILAIVAGLLVFFLGRRYVRKKYGRK